MNNIDSKQIIKEYLINNRQHILDLLNPVIIQKNELLKTMDNAFRNDINSQFEYTCKQLIIKDISEAKLENVSIEDIYVDITCLNLQYYLSADIIDSKE